MKKVLKVIGIILGVVIILGLIFFIVDYNRVQKQEKPIFCMQNPAGIISDGGTIEYFGLGYKVIDFHTLAGYDDIKIGNWFMDYNDFEEEMKVYEEKLEENLEKDNQQENTTNIIENNQNITWEEITADGVNEELLFKNVDKELLTQIATELQTLVSEEAEEERKNPEIVITEGWTRVFKSERYKKVLDMGSAAMKPLYMIIYKSTNSGIYEYICANALYELSEFDFEWTNSKDFLEGFNQKIIESRQ